MLTNNYYQKVVVICLALLTMIIGLSFVLYNQGPRVRLVQFSEDPAVTSLTKGSTMTLAFDRPLEQKDYTNSITISPDLAFTTKTNVQNITLTFDESFVHDTDYTVTVLPDVYDKSNKRMQNKFISSFSTSQPTYAYIERNYGIDYESDSGFFTDYTDADDHVLLAGAGLEPEVIFSHPEIRSFAANRDYIIVVVKEEDRDQLYTVDLATKEVRQDQLQLGGRINNLTLSPRGQIALFTVQPDFNQVSVEYYETFANRVESLNIKTGETLSLTNEAGEYIKAFDILSDNDGQVALVQDQMQSYYAVSPFNDYEPILIGSYSTSFGFNDNASEIVFRDREEIVRYDIASGGIIPVDLDNSGYTRDLSTKNSSIFASSTSYTSGSTSSDIQRYTDWKSEAKVVWRSSPEDAGAISGFGQSYDNNLLAIRQNPESCRFDTIGTNSQCMTTSTTIFDISEQEIVESFRGFDLIWIP
jgi:hypothetical protein